MRKRWAKLLIPLLGVSLLVSLMVSYAYASIAVDTNVDGNVAYAEPAVTSSESNELSSIEEIPDISTLTAPAGALPGHVFVVGNREIVLERPSIRTDNGPQDTSDESGSSVSGTVTARATGASARMIVVDENDRITGIWSNTTGTRRGYYSLRVREESFQGPEHPLTSEILEQYNRLLALVDWTGCGKVY
jgi:hypothetical protein